MPPRIRPKSIVESEELKHVLSMEEYDEEQAVKKAIEESLQGHRNGNNRVNKSSQRYHDVHSNSDDNSNNSSSGCTDNRGSSITGMQTGRRQKSIVKTRPSLPMTCKVSGNKGQPLFDPWLSATASTQEQEDRPTASANAKDSVYQYIRRETYSPRRPQRKKRFDDEPLVLLSTSTMSSSLLPDKTPPPRFTSPRKQASMIEVTGSDEEEPEVEVVEDRTSKITDTVASRKDQKDHDAGFSPNTGKNRRRLMRAKTLTGTIDIISSSDDEDKGPPRTPLNRQRAARLIMDSSDDGLDELSRDNGKNVIKTDSPRRRSSRYPVANDTIPRTPAKKTPTSATATTPLGSATKMSWSKNLDDMDRDSTLDTPTTTRTTRHYSMVLDSEDEHSGTEKRLQDLWSRSQRKTAAQSRHLGLPMIDSVNSDNRKGPLAMGLIPESGSGNTNPGSIVDSVESDVTMQPKQISPADKGVREENDASFAKSQDFFNLTRRNRVSPSNKASRQGTDFLKLTKPRPLVLDVNSDTEPSQDVHESAEDHTKLREILMFEDDPEDETQLTHMSLQQRRAKLARLEKTPREPNEFSVASFPIFERKPSSVMAGKKSNKENDVGPIAPPTTNGTPLGKRSPESADLGDIKTDNDRPMDDDEEEEEEPLVDPRARRRSGRLGMASPPKKRKLTELIPAPSVMAAALVEAAVHEQQLASSTKVPHPFTRTETIESFSTITDSQPAMARLVSANGRLASQADEIEDFSDDQWTQKTQVVRQQQRRPSMKRFSSLQFADNNQPKSPFDVSGGETTKDLGSRQQQPLESHEERPSDPQEDSDYDLGEVLSPIVPLTAEEECPICHQMISADELESHVDEELLANERDERKAMQARDEAMALALDESFHTQDVAYISDSMTEGEYLTQGQLSYGQLLKQTGPAVENHISPERKNNVISLDTPIRKVRHLSLESPLRPEQHRQNQGTSLSPNSVHDITDGESVILIDEFIGQTTENELMYQSRESSCEIQPGQRFVEDTNPESPSPSEPYISLRPVGRKKVASAARSRETSKKPESPKQPATLCDPGQNVGDDDDLGDFLEQPEPASMLSRPYRTKTKVSEASTGASRRKSLTKSSASAKKKTERKVIELDDSQDEEEQKSGAVKAASAIRKGAKPKSSVLDSMLPESARQRRQQLLKKDREQRHVNTLDLSEEIEVSRRQQVTEKLWNQEDDLFDSEQLDRRQVKGIGLGGVIGGIGAMTGSLSISKVTKTALESTSSQAENAFQDNNPVAHQPSYEYEDPNYGLQSQEWWDAVDPNYSHERPRDVHGTGSVDTVEEEQGEVEDDEGDDLSHLGDFVDLRTRRDDPAYAMFFAQFGGNSAVADSGSSRSTGKQGRGRGRGRRGRGGGVSSGSGSTQLTFGPGVTPMSLTMGEHSNTGNTNAARDGDYGARSVSFGGRATTANGSMAIRSKPTLPSVGRGRGRGGGGGNAYNKSGRKFWTARGRGRRGRGRGRGG
ncbi:hypothetical protein BG011_003048 [Mortierella polycephala]|uniref:Uncharacterized protein n=1 Tax=Mortierella polycephala TaxID=41804 RepID=A0A9P6Q364_9FUNG|nr:hypothetical protein BG011_003048 [Mortierella polycephala]